MSTCGYFEEYGCGCVSDIEKRKRDLPGYCGKHGDDKRRVHKVSSQDVKEQR